MLIGREAELERVASWIELLASGPAGLVIGGEAGIGKTVLWASAIEAAHARGSYGGFGVSGIRSSWTLSGPTSGAS